MNIISIENANFLDNVEIDQILVIETVKLENGAKEYCDTDARDGITLKVYCALCNYYSYVQLI